MTHFGEAVERVRRLPWGRFTAQTNLEHKGQLEAYFKNAASFLRSVPVAEGPAFFDAAEMIAPGQFEPLPTNSRPMDEADCSAYPLVCGVCSCYLKWMLVADTNPGLSSGFFDLYEPLMTLFEMGVPLTGVRKGELVYGSEGYSLPLDNWQKIDINA